MKRKSNVLIVDDEQGIRSSLIGMLRDEGYVATAVANGEECLDLLEKQNFDIALLDVWLPKIDGIETLKIIKDKYPLTCVIMISGHGTIETAVKATKLGAFDFLEKPLSYEKTLVVVKNGLLQKRLQEENRLLYEELVQKYTMIGESVPMMALRQQIAFAAPTNARVLIYGENGTGKELVARLLHLNSLRKHQRFVELNCAAIPEELIESELFGHVKGAFTGATSDKQGKFELADGGTLFLDEVADMSLRTQAKVLRALEEQKLQLVGSTAQRNVDVRVIAATNKNLEAEMERGSFREDLFYRLNVIPFQVPPLRERKEDIPLLSKYFLNDFSARYAIKRKDLTPAALQLMCEYNWPGNVRELKNVIERVLIMTRTSKIEVYDLPEQLFKIDNQTPKLNDLAASLQEARESFEKEMIARKIYELKGNISKVAEELQIERSSLYRKMKYYNIPFRS